MSDNHDNRECVCFFKYSQVMMLSTGTFFVAMHCDASASDPLVCNLTVDCTAMACMG